MTEYETYSELMQCISCNNFDTFKMLLSSFDILSFYKNNRIHIADNLLFRAFSYNRFVMMRMLIEHGVSPAHKLNNTQDDNDMIFLIVSFFRHGVGFNKEFRDWFLSYEAQKIMIDHHTECFHSFYKYKCIDKKILEEYKHLFSATELNLL